MRYLVIAITIIMAITTISRTARADMVGAAAGAAQSTTHAAITTATTARNNDIGPLPQSGSAKHSLSGVGRSHQGASPCLHGIASFQSNRGCNRSLVLSIWELHRERHDDGRQSERDELCWSNRRSVIPKRAMFLRRRELHVLNKCAASIISMPRSTTCGSRSDRDERTPLPAAVVGRNEC